LVGVPLYLSHNYLLQSYAFYSRPNAALRAVERAQDFNPVNPDLYLREAEFARGLGRNERAENALRRAIQLNPEHYAPYLLLAGYYDSRANSEEALRYYRTAQELNPLDEEIKGHIQRLEG
jgi:tetratricopeptide (TPR) repeat protein